MCDHDVEVGPGMPSLKGRVALVVGGSSGLGEAMAKAFSRAGADLVIASRKRDRCAEVAARISEETGRRALPYEFHVGRWEQGEALMEYVANELGRLDVLVNSAGLSIGYDSLADVDERHWDAVFAANVKGPFRLCVLAAQRMKASGGGSIINISSTASIVPRPDIVPYAAAKAALNAVSVGLVHAYSPEVRINTIVPGPFHTSMTAGWPTETVHARGRELAKGRMGSPEEVVGAALFLASDEASSFVTGAQIQVDGGAPL